MATLTLIFKSKADKFAFLEKQIVSEDPYEVDDLFQTQKAIQKMVKHVQAHNEFAERAIEVLGTRLEADCYYDLRPSQAIILIAQNSPRTAYLASKTLIENRIVPNTIIRELCSALPDKIDTILLAVQHSEASYREKDYCTIAIRRLKPS